MSVHLHRFEVNADVRVGTEALLQPLLYLGGMAMCHVKRRFARHTHMHLYGNAIADAARAEIVHHADLIVLTHYFLYLVLRLLRKAAVRQLVHGFREHAPCRLHNEEADDDGGQRVEHSPFLAKNDGATDAHRSADGRKGVAAMMPGIGHHRF